MSTKIKHSSVADEASVINKKLAILPETDAFINASNVGAVKLFSENDAGDSLGDPTLRSPETSPDYRLRVGQDTLLFCDSFNATTQNTDKWYYAFATMTASQPGAGTVNFGTVQGTTSSHGAYMRSFQYIPLINTAPIAVESEFAQFISPLVTGEVFLTGLGLPGGVTTPPTDGVFWRLTSAGLEGVIKYNNSEYSTGIIKSFDSIAIDTLFKRTIVISEGSVLWWVDDVLLFEQKIPASNGVPFLGVSAPLFMMKYCTCAVSNTNTIRVARISASLMDINTNRLWNESLGIMGRHSSVGQNGHTMGSTSGNASPTVALVGTQAGSNTSPNAAMAGLGGIFQMTAQVANTSTSGDMIAQYFLNPVPSNNITGRNLVIRGVKISCVNFGAVVATTPTTLVWGLAYGHLSNTMAAVDTASFATATTHSPRRQMLGINWANVGAVVGQPYDKEIVQRFDGAPICIRPGEYIATTVRFLVGTATSNQTLVYTICFDGYWE